MQPAKQYANIFNCLNDKWLSMQNSHTMHVLKKFTILFIFTILSVQLIKSNNSNSERVTAIITLIQNTDSKTILNGNNKISPLTRLNPGSNDPTQCGTYTNALYAILKNESQNKYSITSTNMYQTRELIKKQNNDDASYIYTFGIYSCDLYDPECTNQCFAHFPGHSVGLIKIDPSVYILTQTYVYEYDHKKHIDVLTLQEAINICDKFVYMLERETIDQQFIDYWKDISYIDISKLKNFGFESETKFKNYRIRTEYDNFESVAHYDTWD